MSDLDNTVLVDLTAGIVRAYVTKNVVRPADMPALIASVHAALGGFGQAPKPVLAAEPLEPAVPIRKSVTDEFIISLEDGRKLKSMKRYLAGLGMTPDQYRDKWGLARDYPMVAPAYAAKRSALAKMHGLGRKKVEATAAAKADAAKAPAPRKRGRPKAVDA